MPRSDPIAVRVSVGGLQLSGTGRSDSLAADGPPSEVLCTRMSLAAVVWYR